MRSVSQIAAIAVTGALWLAPAAAIAEAAPKVVASIKPVHSLVAAVMAGVGRPHLLLGVGSPHNAALRPSGARALQEADAVFWVDPGLETFLDRALGAIPRAARVVALAEADGVTLLAAREGAVWGDDDGDEHGADEHGADEHGAEEHGAEEHGAEEHGAEEHGAEEHGADEHGTNEHGAEEHGAEEHAADEHGADEDKAEAHGSGHAHDQGHGHGHGDTDLHIWLDPRNARAMAVAVAATLGDIDPDRADRYRANAERLAARLETLEREIRGRLAPVADTPYVVFHDAYQYFEARFDLSPTGAITIGPERQPGAARLTEVRDAIRRRGAVCVFAEPQFEPRLVRTVTEGTEARTATLDPLGAEIAAGPELYFELVETMATSLRGCLSGVPS